MGQEEGAAFFNGLGVPSRRLEVTQPLLVDHFDPKNRGEIVWCNECNLEKYCDGLWLESLDILGDGETSRRDAATLEFFPSETQRMGGRKMVAKMEYWPSKWKHRWNTCTIRLTGRKRVHVYVVDWQRGSNNLVLAAHWTTITTASSSQRAGTTG